MATTTTTEQNQGTLMAAVNCTSPGCTQAMPCIRCQGLRNVVVNVLTARLAVLLNNEPGQAGKMACPNCGGTLAWSIAPNGHTRGQCSTEGCARWIE